LYTEDVGLRCKNGQDGTPIGQLGMTLDYLLPFPSLEGGQARPFRGSKRFGRQLTRYTAAPRIGEFLGKYGAGPIRYSGGGLVCPGGARKPAEQVDGCRHGET